LRPAELPLAVGSARIGPRTRELINVARSSAKAILRCDESWWTVPPTRFGHHSGAGLGAGARAPATKRSGSSDLPLKSTGGGYVESLA
jgi:hypothetical protein